jgi:hypothetical protein
MGREASFAKSRDKVYAAALAAVGEAGYVITNSSQSEGLIGFKTRPSVWSWGQQGSVLVADDEGGLCRVVISSRAGFQLIDWGEGGRIADRLLGAIDRRLGRD